MAKDGINIPIITTYKGGGTKQAETALEHLGGVARRIAGTLAVTFGAAAMINFTRSAVSAFMAEDKAAKVLGNTLSNLGLGFKTNTVNEWIDQMARATGVSKDELRPAFDSLVRASGSVAQAQKLVALSMDVSAGSGKSVSSVALALTKTLGGNTTALGKMGLGISAATLHTKDASKIIAALSALFRGDASTAADTYAGKVARIGIAWQDAKESIGSGIIASLTTISGDGSITSLSKAIGDFGQNVGDAIRGIGVLIKDLKDFTGNAPQKKTNPLISIPLKGMKWANDLLDQTVFSVFKIPSALIRLGEKQRIGATNAPAAGPNAATGNRQVNNVAKAAAASIAAENAKRLAEAKTAAASIALAKKKAADQARLTKDSQILAKATFSDDMKRLEIGAALKYQLSARDKLELEIQLTKIELQQAISTQNVGLADQLAAKLSDLTAQQTKLGAQITTTPTMPNVFQSATDGAFVLGDGIKGLKGFILDVGDLPTPFTGALTDADLLASKLIGLHPLIAGIGSVPSITPPSLPPLFDAGGNATGRGNHNIPDATGGVGGTPVIIQIAGTTVAQTIIPFIVDNSANGGSTTSIRRGSDAWLL
jgi:hypothetical protein